MKQFDIHFKNIAVDAVVLILTAGEKSEEEKARDSEVAGPIIQNVLAEGVSCAKLKLAKMLESWGQK